MADFYGAPVSDATIVDATRRCDEHLAPFETAVKVALGWAPSSMSMKAASARLEHSTGSTVPVPTR